MKSFQTTGISTLKYPDKSEYSAGELFNITVFYNDTGIGSGIEAATISYSLDGGSFKTENIFDLGLGYYNITINCERN